MAIASLPRVRYPRELPRERPLQRLRPWNRLKLVALIVSGLLLLTIPSGLILGEVLSNNAHQESVRLQTDLRQAVIDGIDAGLIRPLQDRLATTAPVGSWQDPATAQRELQQMSQLRHELDALYATAVATQRAAFATTYRSWTSLSTTAQAAGLSLQGLSDPVARLHAIEASATTPIGIHGVTGVLATYITSLSDRLAAFNAAKAATNALLAETRATLQTAAQYPALKLTTFQAQLDSAAKAVAAVNTPDGFGPVQARIQQTEAGITSLLSARQAAYAELAAARAALDTARAAGIDVSSYASRTDALAAQLSTAGDTTTLTALTAQLSADVQTLNSLLVVTISAPVYHQAMNLDCETSALRVALAYYGFYYTDAQLFANEPVDLRPPVMGPNHTILQWGDPYTDFVGNVNGSESIPTGYGVYYPVIVSVAHSHGLPNAVGGEGYSAATIYAELRAHHPVQVWIEYNWTSYQRGWWMAWDGRRVFYSYGEHAVTLTGVSATQVRVNDVGHGTQYWISKSTFETFWADFDNMAVIFK